MSNTYFEIEKSVTTKSYYKEYPDYTNNYRLSLTAFMGGENKLQLTVCTDSGLQGQSGIGYIILSHEDIDNLIAGLLERKNGEISATGYEKSKFCPSKD